MILPAWLSEAADDRRPHSRLNLSASRFAMAPVLHHKFAPSNPSPFGREARGLCIPGPEVVRVDHGGCNGPPAWAAPRQHLLGAPAASSGSVELGW